MRTRGSENKIKLSNQLQLKTLPPKSKAARQRCLRKYRQVQTWLGNDTLAATNGNGSYTIIFWNLLVPTRQLHTLNYSIQCHSHAKKGAKNNVPAVKWGYPAPTFAANLPVKIFKIKQVKIILIIIVHIKQTEILQMS